MEIASRILSDITVYMKYARYIDEMNRRENWSELVTRNMDMHIKKFPELESEIKEASIFALQSMKVRRAVAPILSLINDMQSPSGLRLTGIKAIGFLGHSSDESVVNALSSIFQNETGEIYETAIGVIGKVGLVQFSDNFLSIVADRGATPRARQNAALSLAEFGVAEASLLLEERLIDPTEYFIETDIDLVLSIIARGASVFL